MEKNHFNYGRCVDTVADVVIIEEINVIAEVFIFIDLNSHLYSEQ